jgi:hypothetical protein
MIKHPHDEREKLGSKVLFIPERYGDRKSVALLDSFRGRDVQHEERLLRMFQKAGYFIERNGSFSGKQGELAFGLYHKLAGGSHRKLDDEITESTNVPRPHELSIDEVRQLNFPIVVKDPYQHGGERIYLLENEEALTRFIARVMVGQRLSDLYDETNQDEIIESIMNGVRTWNFDSEWFYYKDLRELEHYQFQEYVETPSEYHTSFRVLVDAYGEVYSGAIIRSPKKKGEESIVEPKLLLSTDPITEISYSQREYDILLKHPDSPFFLNSQKIVSNAAQGGISIALGGQPVVNEIDQQVLIDHGIDPYNPTIPQIMADRASSIGKAARGMNAYVGVDFIMNQSLDPLFLEANFGPVLTPDEIGITVQDDRIKSSGFETSQYCELALIAKIASK